MKFTGFHQTDFDTFSIDGLAPRMEALRARIQPKFKALGDELCDDVAMLAGEEMYLHIAQHARRKTNPPKDTWMAICHNKRGYKQHPHFQIGLFDDHLFIWFALIYEAPNKSTIASTLLNHMDKVQAAVPSDYVISTDHMNKAAEKVSELSDQDWQSILVRFRDVKKAELLIGRHIAANDPLLSDGEKFVSFAKETFSTLIPIYKLAVL
ncbi:DUF1054 domain-containing protein [Paenibacillus albiflavus]|uniref:UPF0637 protein E0485_06360 n=1 Tax=Paenibacillus albiflavus TaxID=2545760 RepID=A0A4R4EH87_9BACL|nr:DUF1054 domain-containing protein [Paenibacillus albiflavus]TCZ79476.1 DUF1054 domain-containing protein [Paenibacillus albiflavus]